MKKTLSALMSALTLTLTAASASAAPAYSWNLSNSMLVGFSTPTNPQGPWAFVETPSTNILGSYNLLTQFSPSPGCWGSSGPLTCWFNSQAAGSGLVGFSTTTGTVGTFWPVTFTKGVPLLHPGSLTHAAVRWRNPLTSTVTVNALGRFSDIDPNCGDGIRWVIARGSGGVATVSLASGAAQSTSPSAINGSTFLLPGITVAPGDELYFIVARGGDNYCDSTELDVLLTSP